MKTVRFLMIAEIEISDVSDGFEAERAQDRLDAFREASLPSDEGITLYRTNALNVALTAVLIVDGVTVIS